MHIFYINSFPDEFFALLVGSSVKWLFAQRQSGRPDKLDDFVWLTVLMQI